MNMNFTYFLFSIAIAVFSSEGLAQNSLWICAQSKADIPSGYYVQEIAKDLESCTYPKQKLLIVKVAQPNFWMCRYDYMGTPDGYVIVQESKVSTCGCKAPVKNGMGKVYCAGNELEGMKGWPHVAAHKLPAN